MSNMLKTAWDLLRSGSKDESQVALAISAIVAVAFGGLLLAFLYGITARSGSVCTGWVCALSGGCVALLAATGAFSAGALLGLLFGAPRWSEASPGSAVRPNTSLEKVADWLTTIIVGLGLVHLQTLEARVTDLGVWLTNAITLQVAGRNGTPGVVLALTFAVVGFLLVYLWSLRFLPSEIRGAYAELQAGLQAVEQKAEKAEQLAVHKTEEMRREVAQTAEHLEQQVQTARAEFKQQPLYRLTERPRERLRLTLQDHLIDAATVADINRRYAEAKAWIDEPMEGFGPSHNDGYVLEATVTAIDESTWRYDASVTGPAGAAPAQAVWLLHNTYAPDVWEVRPFEGPVCRYSNHSNGGFVLGAVVPRPGLPAVRLALDLRALPGVDEAFRTA